MENKKSTLETKPQEILGYTLTTKQQIWLYCLLATGFRSTIYMLDVASNISVVNEHYKAEDYVWGTVTLLLMYFPPFVFFIIIISRPDLWDEQDGIPGTAKWFGYRIAQIFAFPIWVMYRYAKQFFWGVEALLQEDNEKREHALQIVSQPSHTELYLFLQVFLQAIPQAFLQLYIMLANYRLDKHISQMQVFCIITSLMLVAHKTVSFMWFESQKVVGRKEPWSPKQPLVLQSFQPAKEEIDQSKEITQKVKDEESETTPFLQPRGLPLTEQNNLTNSLITEEADIQSENSISVPTYSAPSRPLSDPNEIILENEEHLTLPDIPPQPHPDSSTIDLPERKIRINGREEDDPLGKSVAFLWWFFFLFSRMLALAVCANLQPFVVIGVFVLHYIIIISHLLHRSGFPSIYKVFIQLCLGYVLVFCFIEFRYKLKNVIVFYTGFFTLMLMENIGMSLSWYAYSDFDGFWYQFVFIIIFGSCVISFMSMAMYFIILKPKVISDFK